MERRDLVAVAIDDGETALVGKTEVLQETFQAALDLGEFRAAELATVWVPRTSSAQVSVVMGSPNERHCTAGVERVQIYVDSALNAFNSSPH